MTNPNVNSALSRSDRKSLILLQFASFHASKTALTYFSFLFFFFDFFATFSIQFSFSSVHILPIYFIFKLLHAFYFMYFILRWQKCIFFPLIFTRVFIVNPCKQIKLKDKYKSNTNIKHLFYSYHVVIAFQP